MTSIFTMIVAKERSRYIHESQGIPWIENLQPKDGPFSREYQVVVEAVVLVTKVEALVDGIMVAMDSGIRIAVR